jgi:hypothetical protein
MTAERIGRRSEKPAGVTSALAALATIATIPGQRSDAVGRGFGLSPGVSWSYRQNLWILPLTIR